jgi:GT2 family glycosyltransferase
VSEPAIGVVVIGRNEGERLVRCLRSVLGDDRTVVYVDSNSTDGSAERARELGASVTVLEPSRPFTAARARNAGLRELLKRLPEARYVQFVDGDCEVNPGWMPAALAFLQARPDVAVACGRRRERHPEASIYNLLCDVEWDTPLGEAKACGGDALMRVAALQQAGGYRDDLIAGEEPELCVRLRTAGWKVWRLAEEMTLHDAGMTRFSQWWRRTMRGGYAFAEGAHLHGAPPERHWVRELRSALLWGGAIPLAVVAAGLAFGPPGWTLALVYPAQVVRLSTREQAPFRLRLARATFLVLGKFAECIGAVKFRVQQFRGGPAHLIEYK